MGRAKKRPAATTTRRGSAEAIAKRKAARMLNRLFEESGATENLDGRTLKRKQRLIRELREGRRGKPLKALEILAHATELLALGETLTSLRKLKPKLPATPPVNEESAAVYLETQRNYGFDPKAWKIIGVDIEALAAAGEPPRRAPGRKAR
ncbi:MAG: hypothetical protein KF729_15990 [Sandaracinaceae bacterium]|nr:hypothetical protein [Sandaracinaceae bacterium]